MAVRRSKARSLAFAIRQSPVFSAAIENPNDTAAFATAISTATGGEVGAGGSESVATAADLPLTDNEVGDFAFVEETNRLYIWNGSGWYNIALINTNPSFDSGGAPEASYLLGLNDSGYISPLTITLLATDPEGIPVTYSALLSDSASNFISISQDSSVFTITPKSVDSIEEYDSAGGTFSVTFKASDGVNLATALSEFSINLGAIQFIDLSGGTSTSTVYTAPNGTIVSVFNQSNHYIYNSNYLIDYMFNNTPTGGEPGAGYYLGRGLNGVNTGGIILDFSSSLNYLDHIIVYPWTRSDSFSNITSIQKSPDGVNWTTVYGDQGLNSTNTPSGTSYRYDFNTTDLYIRINLQRSGMWGISMNEILVYGTPV